jgi:hypothetical protein
MPPPTKSRAIMLIPALLRVQGITPHGLPVSLWADAHEARQSHQEPSAKFGIGGPEGRVQPFLLVPASIRRAAFA